MSISLSRISFNPFRPIHFSLIFLVLAFCLLDNGTNGMPPTVEGQQQGMSMSPANMSIAADGMDEMTTADMPMMASEPPQNLMLKRGPINHNGTMDMAEGQGRGGMKPPMGEESSENEDEH